MGRSMEGSTPNLWCDRCGSTRALMVAHPDGTTASPHAAMCRLVLSCSEEGWYVGGRIRDYCPTCRGKT